MTGAQATPEVDVECPRPVPFERHTISEETGEVLASEETLRPCMSKTCTKCGPKLRRRYVAHFSRCFSELHEEGLPVYFPTLTVDPKVEVEGEKLDEWETRKYLLHCWDKLMKRLRRRSDRLCYAASLEQHEDGSWHLHAVLAPSFTAVDGGDRKAVEGMMREQAFAAGFGAVMDVKAVEPGRDGGIGSDGKPETVAGAVGYVVKYAFKDAAQAESAGERRRSVVCSQGMGYHSEAAKAERKARAEEASEEDESTADDAAATVEEWEPMFTPEARAGGGYADTLTADDRERFEKLDRSRATFTYREKQEGGRWTVYTYERDREAVRWQTYDRWPEAAGARRIHAQEGT